MISAKSRTGTGNYATEIETDQFRLTADEPLENGGSATGPTPTQLLASALAACTSITLRMYADRKAMPITAIEVTVNLLRDDLNSELYFSREIKLQGQISEEQRQRIIQIANACPVSKLLSNQTKINTTLL